MNIHEHQAKELLKEFKIPVPTGHIWDSFLRVFLG